MSQIEILSIKCDPRAYYLNNVFETTRLFKNGFNVGPNIWL